MTTPLPHPAPSGPAESPGINWPEACLPANTSVFVTNELIIPTPPADIWAWLIRAQLWPTWYSNSADIHFLSHTGPDLRDRSRFRWKTFGLRVTSKVLEFEPGQRLAWDAHGVGLSAYHAWLLTPVGSCATRVLTQETQTGLLARVQKALMPSRLSRKHQLWLEGLSLRAQSGPPPSVTPLHASQPIS